MAEFSRPVLSAEQHIQEMRRDTVLGVRVGQALFQAMKLVEQTEGFTFGRYNTDDLRDARTYGFKLATGDFTVSDDQLSDEICAFLEKRCLQASHQEVA